MERFSTAKASATFRAHGRIVTAQRTAAFRAIEHAEGHPTAEELHARLRNTVPGVALKTVYAILHELVSFRLIEVIPLSMGATRWDPNTAPHGHFVCDACHRLSNLPVDPTVLMPWIRRAAPHCTLRRVSLIVQGACGRCADPR